MTTHLWRRLRRLPLLSTTLILLAACQHGEISFGCDQPCTHPYNGLPGSCAKPGQADNTAGGKCEGIEGCGGDPSLQCVNGVCLPCGDPQEACCGAPSDVCNPGGGVCVPGPDFPVCNATCGTTTPGADACCENGCPGTAGAVCDRDTNKCVMPASNCQGQSHFTHLKDLNGCYTPDAFFFQSDTTTDEQSCAQAAAAHVNGNDGFGPIDQTPMTQEVCVQHMINQPSDYTFAYYTQADLTACETALCGGSLTNCNIQSGPCQ